MVPGLLNFPSVYFIRLFILRSSSLLCILHTCVAAVPFPDSSSTLVSLVRYSMLRASAYFCVGLFASLVVSIVAFDRSVA